MISLKELTEQFNIQSSLFDRKFEILEGRMDGLSSQMDEIKDNHLEHLREQITRNVQDMIWVKRGLLGLIGLNSSVAVAVIINLLLK